MAKDSLPHEERLAIVRSFLEEAYDDGLISSALRDTLVAQARRRYIPVPRPDLVSSQAAATATEHPQPATRVSPTPPVYVPPPDRRPSQPTAKAPVPVQTPASTVRTPAPSKPAPTPPRPATPVRTGPTFSERMGKRARLAWSRLSADFAANSLIYLGVLISVVVIFVFFAFGYFGEAVETPSLRSPIFVAVPLLFFALAWILRTKTGVRAAADAVGLIGALILPIMLSAVFQDGADWNNREGIGGWFPLSWVPNYEGSERWIGYAIVGLVCAGIYFLMATRHSIYAYGVAPMLWAAAGALGLYWSDGMSGPQMLIVLAAIVVGLVAASLGRATYVGRTVSVATIRIGVVGAPIVFVFALLFAYNDAIEDGIASPDLADLAYPGALAAGLLAAVLAISSGTAFAWSGLGERTRDAAATVMRVAAYLAAGVALVLALAYETTPGWFGAVLVGYGLAVAVVDHIVGGTGPAPRWIARGAIVVGAALTFVDPAATIVVWSVIAVVACLRATVAPVRSATNAMLPYPTDEEMASLELWMPAFVLVGAGIVRWVAWIDVPTVLMTAAVVAIALQFVPSRIEPLRSFAGFPAVGFGLAAVAMGIWIQESENIYTLLEMGLGLAVLTVVAAGVTFPWLWRLPAVIVAANGATIAIIADLTDANDAAVALIAAVTLCTAGVGLIAASFVPRLGTWCVAHAAYGHVLVYLAVAQAIRFDDAFLVALSVAIVAHAAEGVLAPRGRVPAVEAVIDEQSTMEWVRSVPGVVALVGLVPWVVVGSDQLAWFAEESTRLGVALGALALAYAVAAMVIRPDIVVGTATGLALATSGAAVVIAASDVEAVVGPVWVASVVVAMIAVRWRTPLVSAGAWALAYAGIYLSLYVVWLTYEPDVAPLHHWIPLIVAIAMTVAASLGSVALRQHTAFGPWLMTAAGTSAVAMAVGFAALTIEGWGVVWAWGLAAAGAMAIAAVAYRAGWLAPVVLAYLFVAYGDLLADRIESDAVWWMPFVGVAVAASFVLPGRRSWRITEASPLTMLFAVGVAAYAVADSIDRGASGATMAWTALALAAISVARSEDAWLHAGGVLFIGAGAIESSGWLTICLATVAVVETVLAEVRRKHAYARVLPSAATALWGATCVSGLWWLDLEPGAATAVAISLGATLSVVGLVLAMVYPEPGWSRRWWMPIVALGQAGMVGAGGYGSATLALTPATMAWAIITATEAVLVGIPATVRRFPVGVWVSTVLGGASVVLFMQAFEMPPAAVVFTLDGDRGDAVGFGLDRVAPRKRRLPDQPVGLPTGCAGSGGPGRLRDPGPVVLHRLGVHPRVVRRRVDRGDPHRCRGDHPAPRHWRVGLEPVHGFRDRPRHDRDAARAHRGGVDDGDVCGGPAHGVDDRGRGNRERPHPAVGAADGDHRPGRHRGLRPPGRLRVDPHGCLPHVVRALHGGCDRVRHRGDRDPHPLDDVRHGGAGADHRWHGHRVARPRRGAGVGVVHDHGRRRCRCVGRIEAQRTATIRLVARPVGGSAGSACAGVGDHRKRNGVRVVAETPGNRVRRPRRGHRRSPHPRQPVTPRIDASRGGTAGCRCVRHIRCPRGRRPRRGRRVEPVDPPGHRCPRRGRRRIGGSHVRQSRRWVDDRCRWIHRGQRDRRSGTLHAPVPGVRLGPRRQRRCLRRLCGDGGTSPRAACCGGDVARRHVDPHRPAVDPRAPCNGAGGVRGVAGHDRGRAAAPPS